MSEPYLKIPWGDDYLEGSLSRMEALWEELNKVFRRQIIPSELLPYDPEVWKRKGTGAPPIVMYGAQIPDNTKWKETPPPGNY